MGAVVYNIDADVGCTIRLPVQVLESDGSLADLTGYTGQMKVCSSRVGGILLATASVTIDIVTAVVTAEILGGDLEGVTWRTGEFDLKITSGADPDDIEGIARGSIRMRPTVT